MLYVWQCRPWSDAIFCSIWSGSTLFANAYLAQFLALLWYFFYFFFQRMWGLTFHVNHLASRWFIMKCHVLFALKYNARPTSSFQPIRSLDPDCWYEFTHTKWQTMQIQISWLLRSQLIWIYTVCKGSIHCIFWFSRTRVNSTKQHWHHRVGQT